jgi:hypothetical protein
MDLVLHVGHGKTGTSAIQSFLALNQKNLNEFGIIYPDNGSLEDAKNGMISSGNGAMALNWVPRTEYQGKTILFSSEYLFWEINEDYLFSLKEKFNSVKIILWSRNLLDFSYSEWGQYVKRHGMTESYVNFISKYKANHHLRLLWWLQMVKTLNIDISFRNYSNYSENIITRFCADLPLDNYASLTFNYPDRTKVNRSLTHIEYEFQRVANRITKSEISSQYLSDVLCNKLPDLISNKPQISFELYEMLHGTYSSMLDQINNLVDMNEKIYIDSLEQHSDNLKTQDSLSEEQIDIISEALIMACRDAYSQNSKSELNIDLNLHTKSINRFQYFLKRLKF